MALNYPGVSLVPLGNGAQMADLIAAMKSGLCSAALGTDNEVAYALSADQVTSTPPVLARRHPPPR